MPYTIETRPVIIDTTTLKPVGWRNPDGTVTLFSDTYGATVAEINKLQSAPFTLTTVSTTPATGSCAVQLALKTAAGDALTVPVGSTIFVSTSAGAIAAAVTSLAVLTNGTLVQLVTGRIATFTTTATGLLGVTLTGAAATYYLTIIAPNNSLLTSSAIVVN